MRFVPGNTLPPSVTIDEDVGEPRFSDRPAILNVHSDATDVSHISVNVGMQIL
jgi:hypothetical protein